MYNIINYSTTWIEKMWPGLKYTEKTYRQNNRLSTYKSHHLYCNHKEGNPFQFVYP